MRTFAEFSLAFGLVLGLSAPVWAEDAAPTADRVIATVDGTEITLGHMIVLRDALPAQYQSLPDDVLFQGILDQLIQQTLLSKAVEPEMGKRDVLALENARRAYLADGAVARALAQAVTPQAMQALYEMRFANAIPGTEFNAAHIIVATQAEAAEIRTQLDAGADFAEMARTKSTDGAAANGGDLGWFGPGMMVKEFEDAVVAMKPGEIAGPLQTQFGWHLVKLNDTRPTAAPTFETVRPELEAELQQQAVDTRVAELTAAATITRDDAGIDPTILRDAALLAE
ncbi:MAG: peptidylprolyl isomerase [Paracoccaceae bacterium]|jgi:peptidyl-prolyl cis-trans isomerase C|nr:peptidylprolyl isomerase [Paracoccaceae bacterium]MDP5345004.1 peptidylprolyl isomerase [Paracoccaceae bacterium]